MDKNLKPYLVFYHLKCDYKIGSQRDKAQGASKYNLILSPR
jgi:hypothetical protein